MQTRNHINHTMPAGRLILSSWGSDNISVTDTAGDQVTISGVPAEQLRDAITAYVRNLRHIGTSEQAAAAAWLALLADSVRETADRLNSQEIAA